MTSIKAIDTVYHDHRFRSRLEARWAVFFDAANVRWVYEREGFDLDGVWYLPDFWLPDLQEWVEVKGGEELSGADERKARLLADLEGHAVCVVCNFDGCLTFAPHRRSLEWASPIVFAAFPSSPEYEALYAEVAELRLAVQGQDDTATCEQRQTIATLLGRIGEMQREHYLAIKEYLPTQAQQQAAIVQAKQARFEHGACPW